MYINIKRRGVEQLVARWAHNPKVAGSSPAPANLIPCHFGGRDFYLEILKKDKDK